MVSVPPIHTELLVDDEWLPVSHRHEQAIVITRGRTSEGDTASPGQASLTLDNKAGRYSPRNPRSPLYGRIGRGTPLRVRLGDLAPELEPLLVDEFARTVATGWGTATSGQAWTMRPGGAPSVTAGGASSATSGEFLTDNASTLTGGHIAAAPDVDVVTEVAFGRAGQGIHSEQSVAARIAVRHDPAEWTGYAVNVTARVATGRPGGGRVGVNIVRLGPNSGPLSLPVTVPGLAVVPGRRFAVRVVADGPEIRARVWDPERPEPAVWHSQVRDTVATGGTRLGLYAARADTGPETRVTWGPVTVRPPAAPDPSIRMLGEVSSWPGRRDLSGADLTTPVTASGLLRRLEQGARPLRSVMRRHIPPLLPAAYWPMEEGPQGSGWLASGMPGDTPIQARGMDHTQRSADGIPGSDPLPTVLPGARLTSSVLRLEPGSSWSVSFLAKFGEWQQDTAWHQIHRHLITGSQVRSFTLSTWRTADGHPGLVAQLHDTEDAEIAVWGIHQGAALAAGSPPLVGGGWVRIRLAAWPTTGGQVTWRMEWQSVETGAVWGGSHVLAPAVAGAVSQIATRCGGTPAWHLGHLSVWSVQGETAYLTPGTWPAALGRLVSPAGLPRQAARDALVRHAAAVDVPVTVTGTSTDRLGPYPPGTALDVVRAVEETELGLLTEERDALALAYRTRETRYGRTPDLELDWRDGVLADPFDSEDDDKALANLVTTRRREGSEATHEVTTGPLSTAPAPAGVGVYEDSVDLIVADDEQLPGHAAWRAHLGTWDGLRVSRVSLDLRQGRLAPHRDAILALDTGSVVRIAGAPLDIAGGAPIDLEVLGYTEVISQTEHRIELACAPAGGWTVGGVAGGGDAAPHHVDTDGSVLAAPVGAGDTVVHVRATEGPPWIATGSPNSDPEDVPVDIRIRGEVMTVTHIGPPSTPAFAPVMSTAQVTVPTTSHAAPALVAPQDGTYLISAWGTWGEAGPGLHTLPAGTTLAARSTGQYSTFTDGVQLVGAGAVPPRVATFSAPDRYAAVSIAMAHPALIDYKFAVSNTGPATMTTIALPAGARLLVLYMWDEDRDGLQPAPGGGPGWQRLADTGAVQGSSRITVWTRTSVAGGVETVALTRGIADVHGRLYAMAPPAADGPQPMTVIRGAGGTSAMPHPAGADVRLAHPAIVAL
ncbi:hypothetical protein [Streptomyces bohaiensis]|uniref:hypothetical protein n=1 Tax=Streptomyces bohaiensis TaxID=1431344 RepID=UPI003B7E4AAF